ncbi:probable G-protein coupled receptor 82 [Amia ocellicauda]|uniref:probable G-protein coupled receptor 82 n=1 Tax=Amia ocellicauda TaxID=2972642 RepID=UPI0034648900
MQSCFTNTTNISMSPLSLSEIPCRLCPDPILNAVLAWVYVALAIIGFLSNGLALHDLWRTEMTNTVIFTINIMASDFMLCCSLPFRVAYYLESANWKPESTLCTMAKFMTISLFYINLYCNMCFLLWTSINRYASVVRPKQVFLRAFKRAWVCKALCTLTWVCTVIIIITTNLSRNIQKRTVQAAESCFDLIVNVNRHKYNSTHVLGESVFFLILVLMLTFYALLVYHLHLVKRSSLVGRAQRGSLKVRRKIAVLLLLFMVCFMPYHIQRMMLLASTAGDNCQWQEKQYRVKAGTILLAALSCCVHPLQHLALRSRCCRPSAGTHHRNANSLTDAGQTVANVHINKSLHASNTAL